MNIVPNSNKCCNYTDNTSPTLDQVKAIETEWNTFVNNYFTAIDNKYPSTDLTKIDWQKYAGGTLLRNEDGTSKKNSNGEPLYKTFDIDSDPVEVCREEINAMRLKTLLIDTGDDWISHNIDIALDGARLVLLRTAGHHSIADVKDDPDNPSTVTTKGITTCIAAGKLTIRTHLGHHVFGDYVKKQLLFDDVYMENPKPAE